MVEKYKLYTGFLFGAIWVQLCFGFIADEFVPALFHIKAFVNLLCDVIFLILGIISLRNRRDIAVLASFLVIALISKYLNHLGFIYFINGFRDFIGLIFTVPVIRHLMLSKNKERFVRSFDKQLFIFLVLQPFCIVWQLLKYGADDHGGGSLGYGMSGIVSTLIYIISFYLMTKRWDGGRTYFQNLRDNKILLLLLLPTFMNETKISFIFFICYFVLLLKIDWSMVRKMLMAIPLALCVLFGLGYVYLDLTDQKAEDIFSVAYFQNYFIGEDVDALVEVGEKVHDGIIETDNLWSIDLPRVTKIFLAPEALDKSGGGQLFGAGLGQIKGGTVLPYTPFAKNHKWLIFGSKPMYFSLFIQLGYVGLLWFLFYIMGIVGFKSDVPRGANIKIFLWIIMLLTLLYNDALRIPFYCFILFYIAAYTTYGAQQAVDKAIPSASQSTEG